jgi:DNA-binding CsgD family transcriptional regulator
MKNEKVNLRDYEIQLLQLMADHDNYGEVAKKMFKSLRTVQTYGNKVSEKIGVANIRQAIVWALRNKIIN